VEGCEYKESQVIRKANVFKRQEQAGLPFDNKAARGHGKSDASRPGKQAPGQRWRSESVQTSQPGRERSATVSGGAVESVPAAHVRENEETYPAPKVPLDTRINGPRGSYQINTTRFSRVIGELKAIRSAKGAEALVYFSLWDNRKNSWTKLYVHKGVKSAKNGVRVGDLLTRMKAAVKGGGAQTERSALVGAWQADIDGGYALGSTSDEEKHLPAVFTVVGVHVMGV
jgi:hypothetical protein